VTHLKAHALREIYASPEAFDAHMNGESMKQTRRDSKVFMLALRASMGRARLFVPLAHEK
jgi:quinol monooxygenase YgiN